MSNVVNYPFVHEDGWLERFADYLSDVKEAFYDLSVKVNGVFLLGEYLMLPFYAIYSALYYAEEKIRKANLFLQWAFYLATNAYEAGYINAIFNWYWSELVNLRDDPIGFIRSKIALISMDYTYLMYYPTDFVKLKLYEINDRFYNLVNNPTKFFYNLFVEYGADFAVFLTDPVTYIRAKIASISIDMTYLMYYPITFVKLKLYEIDDRFYTLINNPRQFFKNIVQEYHNDLVELIDGPKSWLRKWLANYFGLPYGFWDNPGYFLYIQMLSTIETYFDHYIDRIKDLVVRFILRFI